MRRQSVAMITALVAVIGCSMDSPSLSGPAPNAAVTGAGPPGGHPTAAADPTPIPGGTQIPGGPFIHTFLPGPPSLGFMGLDIEPNVITNFRGFVAMAYHVGTATNQRGTRFDLMTDIRVFQGEYVGEDGKIRFGTFVFI